jgi:CPA2 family monovalent cation:H+ antiporter-2
VLFFVSVGMLFDPAILIEPIRWPVLATWHHHLRQVARRVFDRASPSATRSPTALTISASLAQIGEFSFILAELGVGLKLLPARGGPGRPDPRRRDHFDPTIPSSSSTRNRPAMDVA